MFNTKSFYPFHKVKVGQWFNYKMVPRMGIELNGLFFPRRRPFPLDFFFKLPFLLGFPNYLKKVVESDKDNLHHVFVVEEDVESKHLLY